MGNGKNAKRISGLCLLFLMVLFTIHYYQSGESSGYTIGVDQEKIGVVCGTEDPVFIYLSEIQEISYEPSLTQMEGAYVLLGEEAQDGYICVRTEQETYAFAGNSEKETKQLYEKIENQLEN